MPGSNMRNTSCHPNCGCNVTPYTVCCLECPLAECYFVESSVKSRTPAIPSEFKLEMVGRKKKVKSLFEQGLTIQEVMSSTGLTRGKVDRAGSYS